MAYEDVVVVIEVNIICSCCGKRITYFCRSSDGKINKHHWMEQD